MLKLCALVLAGWCIAFPAYAGLFADDEARDRVTALQTRVSKLEELLNQQARSISQQTKSMLDLQGLIDAQNAEIRKLRGQNEELGHGLQEAEKRSKDFYVDLDTRLRHFEVAEEAAKQAAVAAQNAGPGPSGMVKVPASEDPFVAANREIESAYSLFKSGSNADAVNALQAFLVNFPGSAHVPNAKFWLGDALYKEKDVKGALAVYDEFLKSYPGSPKAADAMFNIAGCQQELKLISSAKKTLKQLVVAYPSSEAAARAKKLLSQAR